MHTSLLAASLLVIASCSSEERVTRLNGSLSGCVEVAEVCAESFPPQCFSYCADDNPAPPLDCPVVSDGTVICGESPCVVFAGEDGHEVQLCYPPDCTVSLDVETGTETIACPPGGGGGSGGSGGGDPGPIGDCEVGGQPGFAKYAAGTCGSGSGTCTSIPEICIELWAPVCGCDGVTYANECFADGAATSVASEGECPPPPVGL